MFVTINISLVCVAATMHVSTIITVVVSFLTFGTLTSQTPTENLNDTLSLLNNLTNVTDEAPVQMNCTTGYGTPGGCIERRYCDYGTPAIDFTSYAPRGYHKLCGVNEVCCPFSSQLPITPKEEPTNENFDFDDDD